MSERTAKKATRPLNPKVRVSGAGVVHVSSSDIIQSEAGQQQIAALRKIKIAKEKSANRK